MNATISLFEGTGLLVLIVLTINNLYLLIFSIAGYFSKSTDVKSHETNSEKNFLVVFPVYKDDEVILNSISNFMRQEYSTYHVTVIADGLKDETISLLLKKNISICQLQESDKRNKAKAINILLEKLTEKYDVCVIMDADNHVEDNFLRELNGYFLSGALAVQTQRIAKNKNNNLSKLDAFSENINNHIFRKGQRSLGFSSSLIGSGMAFEMNLFSELMKGMNVVSGFDKELELRLLQKGIKIRYAENIIVYDEKVSNHQVFINQRRRWIFAQIYFLRKNFFKAIAMLLKENNTDYANKVFQFILLPRVIGAGLSFLFVVPAYFMNSILFTMALINILFMTIALTLPLLKNNKVSEIINLALDIPRVFINMLYALITSGRASKKFLHTPHNSKQS